MVQALCLTRRFVPFAPHDCLVVFLTSARHRQVVQHPTRRRLVRLALPAAAATLLTGTVVGLAVGTGNPGTPRTPEPPWAPRPRR